MKSTTFLSLAVLSGASAFSVDLSRREIFQAAMAGAVVAPMALIPVDPARAAVEEETPRVVTRMGGLLVGHKIDLA